MSTLYITEFKSLRKDRNALVPQIAALPAVVEQTVTISGTSAQSSALNAETTMVRLVSDVTCSILIGANPTATTAKMRLTADSPEYFMAGNGDKIAVISNT